MARPGSAALTPRMVRQVTLVVILVLAATLRLIGLDFGRPFGYHPDEGFIVRPAMNIVRHHDMHPHMLLYPSGLIYAEAVLVAVLRPLTGATIETGRIQPIGKMSDRGPSDQLPEQFVYTLAGRVAVALMGVLSVLLTALVARRLAGVGAGLAAGLFLTVMPLATQHSHYLTTDVPTSLVVALCLWCAARSIDSGKHWLVWAGPVAGIASSVKYNGGFIIGVPVLLLLLSSRMRDIVTLGLWRWLLAIVVAGAVGFLAVTPVAILDPTSVIEALRFQALNYSGHPGAEGTDNLAHHLRYLFGVQHLVMALSGLGVIVAIVRRRPYELALVVTAVAYLVIVSMPVTRYERNLVPLLPPVAILASLPIGLALERTRCAWSGPQRAVLATFLGLVILAAAYQPLRIAIDQDAMLLRIDTRTSALRWIEANIPAGSSIVREEFTPQVPAPTYRSSWVFELVDLPLDEYRALGVDFLIASSLNFDRYKDRPVERAIYDEILAMPIVFEVAPSPSMMGPRIVIVRLPT